MTFVRIFLNAKKPFKLYDKLYKNIVYYLFNTTSFIYCELFKIDILFLVAHCILFCEFNNHFSDTV